MTKTTRRTVLGAIALAPLTALAGPPRAGASAPAATAPPPDRARWERRLARYRRLHAAGDEYGNTILSEADRIGGDAQSAAEDVFGRHMARSMDAMRVLVLTPAPRLADLAVKVRLWIGEGGAEWNELAPLAAILADVERFARV